MLEVLTQQQTEKPDEILNEKTSRTFLELFFKSVLV